MKEENIDKGMKLSEHLASPSVASLSHLSELDGVRLSPHFTLGEMTKTSYDTRDGNMPDPVAIGNLRRLCEDWLEDLRYSYNTLYGDLRGRRGCSGRDPRSDQQHVPLGGGEPPVQGLAHEQPPDGLCRRHTLHGAGAADTLRGHPARHGRRQAAGVRRAALRAEGHDVLDSPGGAP